MKGIINKGIQEFVEDRFGAKTWEKIMAAAGCDEPFFAVSLDYPDEMTANLIGTVAEVAGVSADTVMIDLGKFVVPNSLKHYYPAYFALAGRSSRDFLLELNRIHREVTKTVSNAKPPFFQYEDMPDGRLAIYYNSERGLCRLLYGLILGVGVYFGDELKIDETSCMRNGDPRCTMEVTFP